MSVLNAHGTGVTWNAAAVLQIISVNGPAQSADHVDTTHMGTTGMKRTKQLTVVDSGRVEIEKFWDPDDTVDLALQTDFEAKTTRSMVITETDPTPKTKTFTGLITALNITRRFDGALMANLTVEVSGAITHA